MDGESLDQVSDGPEWVSAGDAADAAGVSIEAVREWARTGQIVHRPAAGPVPDYMFVRLADVRSRVEQQGEGPTPDRRATSTPGNELAPILKSIPEMIAKLTEATDRAARAETKVEFLRDQMAELKERLDRAESGSLSVEGEHGARSENEPSAQSGGAPADGGSIEAQVDETREASSWGDLWGSGSGRSPVHERELTEDIWAEPPPPVDYEQALEDPKPKSRRWRRRSR